MDTPFCNPSLYHIWVKICEDQLEMQLLTSNSLRWSADLSTIVLASPAIKIPFSVQEDYL